MLERHGRLDAAVNNAGIVTEGTVSGTRREDWRRVMGAARECAAEGIRMKRYGMRFAWILAAVCMEDLRKRGHKLNVAEPTGATQLIVVDPTDGSFEGQTETRAQGKAEGF